MEKEQRERCISGLVAKGLVVTEHNILCEGFAQALEAVGGGGLLDTICYEGSEAQMAAQIHDDTVKGRS